MKSRAEHYLEAERFLGLAQEYSLENSGVLAVLGIAQIHATLAIVDPLVLWSAQQTLHRPADPPEEQGGASARRRSSGP